MPKRGGACLVEEAEERGEFNTRIGEDELFTLTLVQSGKTKHKTGGKRGRRDLAVQNKHVVKRNCLSIELEQSEKRGDKTKANTSSTLTQNRNFIFYKKTKRKRGKM